MCGSREKAINFRNWRDPLNSVELLREFRREFRAKIRVVAVACAIGVSVGAVPAFGQSGGPTSITLDDAIQMALQHNHNMLAARTTIQQSEAEEITANLRPNPSLFADWEYLPINHSGQNAQYLQDSTEGDLGLSYLIERGKKRQHRLQAA